MSFELEICGQLSIYYESVFRAEVYSTDFGQYHNHGCLQEC
jgi:hypothetical protein